jgi:hypothetical protein
LIIESNSIFEMILLILFINITYQLNLWVLRIFFRLNWNHWIDYSIVIILVLIITNSNIAQIWIIWNVNICIFWNMGLWSLAQCCYGLHYIIFIPWIFLILHVFYFYCIVWVHRGTNWWWMGYIWPLFYLIFILDIIFLILVFEIKLWTNIISDILNFKLIKNVLKFILLFFINTFFPIGIWS